MASDDWAERQKILLSAGILVTTQDAKEKIEALDNLTALIEAANASNVNICLLYTSPSPRDRQKSRMPSSA